MTLLNASNKSEWIPSDGGEYEMIATHWVVYPDEHLDEDSGEVRQFGRLVLIDAEGRNVKFSSDFMLRRLHAAVQMFTPAEWARGIRVRCYTQDSRRKGRRYGTVEFIGVAE